MAATRASGTNANRCGTTRENVLALKVPTADGETIRTSTRARKSALAFMLMPQGLPYQAQVSPTLYLCHCVSQEHKVSSSDSMPQYIRQVSGQTISNLTVETSVGRVEIFRRSNPGPNLNWDFCQPELTLFWHREGFKRMHGRIAGAPVDLRFVGGSNLSIFAPATEIHTIFDTYEHCDYVAAFFSRDSLNSRGLALDQTRIAFHNEAIQRSLAEICREAEQPDDLFELYAEGWAIQMLARVAKIARSGVDTRAANRGGLPTRTLKKLDSYVRENIANSISLDQMASVALVSKRHFLRAFGESVGVTPHRFVMGLRIDEAKVRLRSTSDSVTEIAFSCGFAQPQHFSTTFRKLTGLTPLRYRQDC